MFCAQCHGYFLLSEDIPIWSFVVKVKLKTMKIPKPRKTSDAHGNQSLDLHGRFCIIFSLVCLSHFHIWVIRNNVQLAKFY